MRILRIALPLLLVLASAACAANGGAASSEAAAKPSSAVTLVNRDEIVRLMSSRYTPEMRRLNRDGYAIVEVSLDAGGAVTATRFQSGGGGVPMSRISYDLAPRLRFTRPAAAGQRVLVRMSYDRDGRPGVFLEG